MKKIIKNGFLIIFVFSFLFCGFTLSNKAHASGSAPPVTEFSIIGYSWPELFSEGSYYLPDAASSVSVPDSTAYIIVRQIGYGSLGSNYYSNMSTYESYPITDSYNVVVGFIKVIAISNLSQGLQSINLNCTSYSSPWNTMSDSIQLDIQPNISSTSSISNKSDSLRSDNSLVGAFRFSSLKNLKN
jgi:hypothetical protein